MAFNYKFQAEHLQGIHTTGMGRVRFGTAATVINAIQDAKLRIANDTSRSESEKKALIRKLLDESHPKLSLTVWSKPARRHAVISP